MKEVKVDIKFFLTFGDIQAAILGIPLKIKIKNLLKTCFSTILENLISDVKRMVENFRTFRYVSAAILDRNEKIKITNLLK